MHQEVFNPRSQYVLCRSVLGSEYSFEASWVCRCLHQLCTSGFGDFLPFFLVDLLKLCEVGWGVSVNSNLQVFPQILKGIQVWATQGLPCSCSEAIPCCFVCMLGVIVLLERKSSPQCEVFLHSEAGSPQGFAWILLHSLFPLSLQVSQSLLLKSTPIA